ncbi:acyl-CoA thioesterase, partial [Acinetobacter baumannii]
DYLIFDAKSGKRLTKGYTTQVAVNISNREMCLQSPQVLFERLTAWSEFQPTRGA